jgi:Ca2+-dependent lipid-binding protein
MSDHKAATVSTPTNLDETGQWIVTVRAGRRLLSCDINGKSDPWLVFIFKVESQCNK